ncbi:hypothetical protein HanRHA438_Chr03g0147481 [Helianthus annuus]|nr:hypothetical protein HanRHA438_Chr03g0147481 [Helianthus annuus]
MLIYIELGEFYLFFFCCKKGLVCVLLFDIHVYIGITGVHMCMFKLYTCVLCIVHRLTQTPYSVTYFIFLFFCRKTLS